MKRSLVTGGAGFLGRHLVSGLAALGDRVLVVDTAPGPVDGAVDHVRADVRDRAAMFEIAGDFRPQIVYHLAAQADPRRAHADPAFDLDVNAAGTLTTALAALSAGAERFVFVSTGGAMYGDPAAAQLPVGEDYPPAPVSPYGLSKYCAELYLDLLGRTRGLSYSIVRPGNIYGPGQDASSEVGVVTIFLDRMLTGKIPQLRGRGLPTRDYVYVDDVVAAILLAAERGAPRPYNIGSGRQTSVRQIFDEISNRLGLDVEPELAELSPGEVGHMALDCSAAARDLGWAPRIPLGEGLDRTIAWARRQSASGVRG
ncbi:MAG: NAD-dependent epimerase/dehydratase family protein [Chloroflexi bacterium]|nr:NAD-dependent epimerase/dehydratase family protein [Chloroflexota bacterium]MYB16849.1 NAD-dependent epimerase/dehydratase family protein [Chloroflexota bacterium]